MKISRLSLIAAAAVSTLVPQDATAQQQRMVRDYGLRTPVVVSFGDNSSLGFKSGVGLGIGAELVRPRTLVLARLNVNTSDKKDSAGTSYSGSAMAYRDFGRLEGFSAGGGLRLSVFDGELYKKQAVRAALGVAYSLDEQRIALEFAAPISDRNDLYSATINYRYGLRGTGFADWVELNLGGSIFKTQGVAFLDGADEQGMSKDYTFAPSIGIAYAISFNGPRPEMAWKR